MGRNQPKQKGYPALGAVLALGMLATGCMEATPPQITSISDAAVEVTTDAVCVYEESSSTEHESPYQQADPPICLWEPIKNAIEEKANQGCSAYEKRAIYQGQTCGGTDTNVSTYCYGGSEPYWYYNYSTGIYQYVPGTPETCSTSTNTYCTTTTYIFSCI